MPLRFVNPNFHVILIHYPLGVFVLGVILEALSFMWRRSSIRVAARWMILLGALLMIPAATSGIYALLDVKENQDKNMLWEARTAYLSRHVWVMGSATILGVLLALIGLGASNRMRQKLRPILVLGLLATVGMMVYGAWFGGETIYRQGTSISMIRYKKFAGEGDNPAEVRPYVRIPVEPQINLKDKDQRYNDIVGYFIGGDKQLHIIISGLAFAAALGALGLSIRRYTTLRAAEEADLAALTQETGTIAAPQTRVADDVTVVRTLNPGATVDPEDSKVPVGRFWLLAALLALVAAVAGYWTLSGPNFLHAERFQSVVWDVLTKRDAIRHYAHIVLGVALVVIALLFAVTALSMPRHPIPLMLLGILLVFIVGAQTWVGVQMTFDQDDGWKAKYLFHLHVPEATDSGSAAAQGNP